MQFASPTTQLNPYGSAGDTYAALTREQWRNYVSTFVPIENQLIDFATDRNRPTQAMQDASAGVNAAYDVQAGTLDRRMRGLGITFNPDEQAAQNRSQSLSRSLADVGAQNMARDLTVQRQQSLLGNPAPQVPTTGG